MPTPSDLPDDGLPPLRDLVDDRSDLADLRPILKDLAASNDMAVDDVLAMSRRNDATYVQPSDLEKAQWFAEIYDAEGRPETHPRDFHYRILGEGYETRDGEDYINTQACWRELKEAAFWAQLLGLVDPDRIGDAKNNDPVPTAFTDTSDPGSDDTPYERAADEVYVSPDAIDTGYRPPQHRVTLKPARLQDVDAADIIEWEADRLVEDAFAHVSYDATQYQDYYLELWAEKAGVLDRDLATEYGATIREAGGGEFSFQMVRDAVRIARERSQALVVVVVSDYDPKGMDMPKSAARKIEAEAAIHDVDAFVHHGALTRDQVADHAVPASPAKEPRGIGDENPGALAYERQKDYFEEYAQGDPVEVNSFRSRHPDAYRDALASQLDPYYDDDLDARITEAIEDAREDAREAIRARLEPRASAIQAALDDLEAALTNYQRDVTPAYESVRDELDRLYEYDRDQRATHGVDDAKTQLQDALDGVALAEALAEVEVSLPDVEIDPPTEDALLDTRRGYVDQLAAYKTFDIREPR